MASFAEELLSSAKILLKREPSKRGRLPDARVRRAASTAYYALFHFLCDEAARRIAGSDNYLSTRRRVLGRVFTHKGMRTAFDKVRGQNIDISVADLFRGAIAEALATPPFAREMARTFVDAKAKREDADYDRNAILSEADATILISRIELAIEGWRTANGAADRDFKHALFLLMLLKGQLRGES